MKIWYDTEFLEDGITIELISIGMVAEDGRELYAVNEAIQSDTELYGRICHHDWLMANVIPHLPLTVNHGGKKNYRLPTGSMSSTGGGYFGLDLTSNLIMPGRMIRNAVREFITATPDPQLWAWYGAYDHVALAQLFGRMIDLPEGFPMWTNDLKQEATRLGATVPDQGEGAHNALEDARHNRAIDAYLKGLTS